MFESDIVVYISLLLTIYQSHINSVEHVFNLYPNYLYIFCGDYTLPEVLWINDDSGLTFSASYYHAPCNPEFFASNCYTTLLYLSIITILCKFPVSIVHTTSTTLLRLTIPTFIILFLNLIGRLLYQFSILFQLLIPCMMLFPNLSYVLYQYSTLNSQSLLFGSRGIQKKFYF